MKKDYKALNDTELEKVNGGLMFVVFASGSIPVVDPVPLKPEYEKVRSERNVLIPIP